MAYVTASAPETNTRLLRRSFDLYKTAFNKIFIMAFVLSCVVFLPRIGVLLYGPDIDKINFMSQQVIWLILDIFAIFFFTAILWDMRCVMVSGKESLFSDFKKSLQKIPLIVGASVIEALIFLASTLTLLAIYLVSIKLTTHRVILSKEPLKAFLYSLPMLGQVIFNFLVFILFLFYLPIIVTENKGIFSALMRSAKLVWKNIWRVLKLQITPWFIYSLFLIFFKYTFELKIHIYFFPAKDLTWGATLVHMILFAFFAPWSAATLLVQLHDLELRKNQKTFDQV